MMDMPKETGLRLEGIADKFLGQGWLPFDGKLGANAYTFCPSSTDKKPQTAPLGRMLDEILER